jgi:hypothetical protein
MRVIGELSVIWTAYVSKRRRDEIAISSKRMLTERPKSRENDRYQDEIRLKLPVKK